MPYAVQLIPRTRREGWATVVFYTGSGYVRLKEFSISAPIDAVKEYAKLLGFTSSNKGFYLATNDWEKYGRLLVFAALAHLYHKTSLYRLVESVESMDILDLKYWSTLLMETGRSRGYNKLVKTVMALKLIFVD